MIGIEEEGVHASPILAGMGGEAGVRTYDLTHSGGVGMELFGLDRRKSVEARRQTGGADELERVEES